MLAFHLRSLRATASLWPLLPFGLSGPARAQGADLNKISSLSVGRVEVLRDGASAQYGSDAKMTSRIHQRQDALDYMKANPGVVLPDPVPHWGAPDSNAGRTKTEIRLKVRMRVSEASVVSRIYDRTMDNERLPQCTSVKGLQRKTPQIGRFGQSEIFSPP